MSKYIDNTDAGYLPHNRSEIQGHIQWLFSEDASTLAEARAKGFLDMGVFLGVEIKSEEKSTEVKKAREGKIFTAYKLGGEVTLGLELTTKEVADMRKARLLLMGDDKPAFTQAALTDDETCALPNFNAQSPAKLNHAYQIVTASGVPVRNITDALIGDLTEGVDYVIQKKLGLVRFIKTATLPAAALELTITAAAITADSDDYMESIQPMQTPRRRGYSHFIVWSEAPGSDIAMEFEPRPTEVSATGGFKVDGENQAEAKITITFTSTDETVRVRS
jgi:hypothetical protein